MEFSAELLRNQWKSRANLEAIQERKFRAMAKFAYDNVPYYRGMYKRAGVSPDDIHNRDDFRKLPFVTKDDLKTVPIGMRIPQSLDIRKCSIARTSGSTGEPLKVAVDDESNDFVRAYHLRRFLALGFRPWDKLVVLGPSRRSIVMGPVESTPAAGMFLGDIRHMLDHRIRYVSVDSSLQSQATYFGLFRPDALLGPPSYFKMLARVLDGSQEWHPDKVLTWGEILDGSARVAISRSLGAKVYDGYGCTEVAPVGGLAWECTAHSGMHVNIDCVMLEVLREGEPVSPGESGEVVVTSLYRHSAPMIRYKLGDMATLADEACPCGRGLPLLRELDGRVVDFLLTPDGRAISPYYISRIMERIAGISMFRVVQDTADHARVTIEMAKDYSAQTRTQVEAAISSLLGPTMLVDCDFVPRIDRERGRKFKAVARDI